MNVTCLIQARMSSNRFPKKSLKLIGEKSLIRLVYDQVCQAKRINKTLVITSTDDSDDELCSELNKYAIPYFRGSLEDVLDRFYKALSQDNPPNFVVRVTGDCPFIDSELIDLGIEKISENNFHYVSNVYPPTFPDGLDFECFSYEVLEKAWRYSTLKEDREHVTPFIRKFLTHNEVFNIENKEDLSMLRWTIDYEDDYFYILKIYDALMMSGIKKININDVLKVIKNYKLIQPDHLRNEKYLGI